MQVVNSSTECISEFKKTMWFLWKHVSSNVRSRTPQTPYELPIKFTHPNSIKSKKKYQSCLLVRQRIPYTWKYSIYLYTSIFPSFPSFLPYVTRSPAAANGPRGLNWWRYAVWVSTYPHTGCQNQPPPFPSVCVSGFHNATIRDDIKNIKLIAFVFRSCLLWMTQFWRNIMKTRPSFRWNSSEMEVRL